MSTGIVPLQLKEAEVPVSPANSPRRLEVFLIRPTKYDDDGYLLRHVRGVLPSNSLACLHALTEDVRRRKALGNVEIGVHLCDESVQTLPERRMRQLGRDPGTKIVACLVGAQTNQFPRTIELTRRFREHGWDVIIGGFHVSGSLALTKEIPPHLQELMDQGVTLVKGEVEETWAEILRDAAGGALRSLYDTIDDKPDLLRAPMPHLDSRLMSKFVYRHFGTLDAGRGCPFTCSFCTIINVQGRKMRFRDAGLIGRTIEENYGATGTHHYFFTDDNFARNTDWRGIFAELIRLRETQGIPIRFLMQVDTLSHKIADFIPMAKRAGCFQVFIGMESLNPESLADGGKRQNRVADYAALIDAWRRADILTHVGYIIGFPHDTPERVRENLLTLRDEIRVDLAAFFMLTPLPGSVDHLRLLQAGTPMDEDLNRFDTFHPVLDHPHMSRETWFGLYRDAWSTFYTPAHMHRQLTQLSARQRTTLLQMYLWYTSATVVESYHPMMTGFFRVKPRTDRRPGYPIEGRLRHCFRRIPEVLSDATGYGRILRQLHDLWLATCQPLGGQQRGRVRGWTDFLGDMFGLTPSARAPAELDGGVAPVPVGGLGADV